MAVTPPVTALTSAYFSSGLPATCASAAVGARTSSL
jgi:hypothetical protein